jgi:hypothetical protein
MLPELGPLQPPAKKQKVTLDGGAQEDSHCHSLKELVIRIEKRVENMERRQQLKA